MTIARTLAIFVLAALALVQAVRFLWAWPVLINGFAVPLWASAVAAVVLAALAVLLWRDGAARSR